MKRPATPIHNVLNNIPSEVGFAWDEQPTNPGIHSTQRVLIAEDDPALRSLMVKLLVFEGYFVTEVVDALEMLDAVQVSHNRREAPFDLIVTDVRMPGLTGLDALAILRQSGCTTPAIIVSALPGEMVQPDIPVRNAFFLPKPFALENLRRIANRVVRGESHQTSSVT